MNNTDRHTMKQTEAYAALALQSACQAVNGAQTRQQAQAIIHENIDRLADEIRSSAGWIKSFHGVPLKLVVLPEYILTGFPLYESFDDWGEKAAVEPGSNIHKVLGEIASSNNLYLAINLYERNELAPSLYFQSVLVFGPCGKVILRYLRMISINSPSPYDFWDRYVQQVGMDNVFPVVDTEIGRLGAIASEEILYPEVARALGFKGAEILVHCTSEVGSPSLTPKDIAKRARAVENSAYVISANTAGIFGTPMPASAADAMSKIVGPEGAVIADTSSGSSMNASAVIDLQALRARRMRSAMTNLLPRVPAKAFENVYGTANTLQPNGMEGISPERIWLRERISSVAKTLFPNEQG